jgi:hypothetical protein
MNEMSIFQFTLLGLATYRITRLATRDMITAPLRNAFWKKFPPESSRLGYLSTCEWCLSFWTGSGLVISAIIIPTVTYIVATICAVSAIAGLLTAYEDK